MKKSYFILAFVFFALIHVNAQVVGTDVGDIAPEIDLPDAKGTTIALSSLRGGLVLVDFWATWCGPCLKEQPELLKLYNTYPDKLSIYGVSLDNKKANWVAMVAKLKQPWSQVSDIRYWSSPVVGDYMIQALPFNVLLDKNGVVLAKNIHGNALNEMVKSLVTTQ
jgi:thiol-disulfide isomerase/thioredoxin